jgi:hypothetical protein
VHGSVAATAATSSVRDLLALRDSSTVGILLHHRFSNLPVPLIGPLFRNLENDVSWVQSSAEIKSPELSSRFSAISDLILFCPCSLLSGVEIALGASLDILGSSSSVMLDSFEDEMFLEHAEGAAVYRPRERFRSPVAVICISLNAFKVCIQKLATMSSDASVSTSSLMQEKKRRL